MIELKNIYRVYGKGEAQVHALNGIDLSINDGEMVAVIGPSGCGKTTLLNIIGCIDKATKGQYLLNGNDISDFSNYKLSVLRNQMFGFVVQDFALINDYTIYQNVVLPINYSQKTSEKSSKNSIIDLLKRLGILEKKDTYPTKLSGGQKQRVAIARALVNNPQIILADEPTGALDQKNGQEIIELFKKINNAGKTVIIVTHDMNIANQCDRIIKMVDGKIFKS